MNTILSIFISYILIMSTISAFFKSLYFSYFYLNTHDILNGKIPLIFIKFGSLVFVVLEFFIPLISLVNLKLYFLNTIILTLIYLVPTIILIYAIVLGNRNQNCGCFGIHFKMNINWRKVIENSIYIIVLLYCLFLENIEIKIWHIIIAIVLNAIHLYILQRNKE